MRAETETTGASLSTILLVVFIVMKLAKVGAVAEWSWWWVLSPMWIPLGLAIVVIGAYWIASSIGVWLDQRAALRRALRGDE